MNETIEDIKNNVKETRQAIKELMKEGGYTTIIHTAAKIGELMVEVAENMEDRDGNRTDKVNKLIEELCNCGESVAITDNMTGYIYDIDITGIFKTNRIKTEG